MRFLKSSALALAFVVFVGPFSAVSAQTEPPFPNSAIGVIDLQRIMAEVTVGATIQAEHDKYLQKYQADAQAEERALQQEAQKVLGGERDQKSEAFQKKRQDFERKVNAFQAKVSVLRRNLDRAMSQAQGEIYKVIIQKAEDIATERGLNLIVYKHQTLLFDPRMEISEEVLKRVNETLTTVAFPDPGKLPDVPAN